ncbi:MAG TPA: thiamine pyrophosphate-dependent enzyme [Dokdonella sp.]|uniref:thiamine pyrophosphate-dependent enzyme n=1 Tax=Dokdonella sp. TaxID=2291710 RepID=UPI002D7E79F0|nr:thiamine pyrophosphate-dependent enzyme [Dokdonella sp.]HET9032567.1 thiamine pyrophosphate-dependent enzyme [Dokdonella sp.]
MSRTLCDLLLENLADAGVSHIFGVPGDAINSLVDSLRRCDSIDFIQVRHEESGAFAASAQAKLTGKLAVCCGTAGPGAIHLLNGLYDAKRDHAPVLAITGQVETTQLGHHYHQEIDQDALFRDVAVYNRTVVTAAQAPRMFADAIQAAVAGRGVAHLALPSDVAAMTTHDEAQHVFVDHPRTVPSDEHLDRAAKLLAEAKCPVIFAGIGAADAVDELVAVAERLGAPIVHSLRGKDLLADDHAFNIGGLGMLGGKPAVEAMDRCDVLLMVGTDFPYQNFYPERTRAIQIESNPLHLGRRHPLAAGLIGHAQPTLRKLLERIAAKPNHAFLQQAQHNRKQQLKYFANQEAKTGSPVPPHCVPARAGALARDDAIFVCDTGEVTVWTARHLHLRQHQRLTLSCQLASMAFALPGAIGAQLAYPDRQVVALCGDGGFSMLMVDFLTAVKYALPITVIVFNNHKFGLIQAEQEASALPEFAVQLHNPDFAAYARLCGGEGWNVNDVDQLDAAIKSAYSSNKPSLISVEVDADVLPMPPEISMSQAINFSIGKLREMAAKLDF